MTLPLLFLSTLGCVGTDAFFETADFVAACEGLRGLQTETLEVAELGTRQQGLAPEMIELEKQYGTGSAYQGIDVKIRLFGPNFPAGRIPATILQPNTRPADGTAVIILEAAGPDVNQDGGAGEVTFNGRGFVTVNRAAGAPQPGQTVYASATIEQWVHTETEDGADLEYLSCGTSQLLAPSLRTIQGSVVLPEVSIEDF